MCNCAWLLLPFKKKGGEGGKLKQARDQSKGHVVWANFELTLVGLLPIHKKYFSRLIKNELWQRGEKQPMH